VADPQKPYDPLEPLDSEKWARVINSPPAIPPSEGQNQGLLSDYGTDIKLGLLQLPGAATGLADILVQGALGAPRAVLEGASALTGDDTYHQWSQAANQPWVSKGAEALGEFTGVEPGKWADQARQEYSPERQAAKAEVDQAWEEGGAGNIAGAYLSNPAHTIGGLVAESLPATVAGGFVFGLPSLVAVFLNYLKRSDVSGTWLESHFRWQIRTFWFALAWAVLVGLVSLPLMLIVVGFGTWMVGMFMLGVWAIYRIARGWLRLNARQAMPVA
jgi:uncharacterized membrane protein